MLYSTGRKYLDRGENGTGCSETWLLGPFQMYLQVSIWAGNNSRILGGCSSTSIGSVPGLSDY